jgi:hypothetical protein
MITIYWCKGLKFDFYDKNRVPDFVGIRNPAPAPVKNILNDQYKMRGQYNFCPAYRNHLINLYSINAPLDYSLNITDSKITSSMYDQKFFDEFVTIRSLPEKLISLNNQYMLIPDCPNLEMTLTSPYLESNAFADNIVAIPATFDIGKWPRFIECAFHMKNNSVSLKEGDAMLYLKFHTDEKIVFKHFIMTPMMNRYMDIMTSAREFKRLSSTMEFFYNLIDNKKQLKKKMLLEAKANVID